MPPRNSSRLKEEGNVGRGGSGEPAALMWDFLRGGHAYFICKII